MSIEMELSALADVLCARSVAALGTGLHSSAVFRGVSTDSRHVQPSELFFAIRGEHFDGHDFISSAVERGAAGCVIESSWFEAHGEGAKALFDSCQKPISTLFFVVEDTTQALGQLGRYWRSKLSLPTIAVTGSVGKTTTKQMLGALLTHALGKGISSDKSFNNHLGVPLTILRTSAEDRWLVLETGMNHAGELDYLGSIAQPDVAIILNVRPAHLEFFKSIEEIADAKCELLAHLKTSGHSILNGDDSVLLSRARLRYPDMFKNSQAKFFGSSGPSASFDCYVRNFAPSISESQLDLVCQSQSFSIRLPFPGAHNALNAAAALLAAHSLFPSEDMSNFARGLELAQPAAMRFESIRLHGLTLINDAYNANPASVEASVTTVAESTHGSFGVVLGEMRELGEHAEFFHEQIGEFIAIAGASLLICVGNYSNSTALGARKNGLAQTIPVATVEDAVTAFLDLDKKPQTILVKGSRAGKLEDFVSLIKERLG